MKTIILLIALSIISFNTSAQFEPFVGVSIHSKGFSTQVGAKYENALASIGYSKPFTSSVNPTLFFGNVGYEFNLTPEKKDGYNLTPLIGISSYTFEDVVKEETVKGVAPIYSLELGKDIHNGRLFTHVNYCRVFYIGAGFKIFIR